MVVIQLVVVVVVVVVAGVVVVVVRLLRLGLVLLSVLTRIRDWAQSTTAHAQRLYVPQEIFGGVWSQAGGSKGRVALSRRYGASVLESALPPSVESCPTAPDEREHLSLAHITTSEAAVWYDASVRIVFRLGLIADC